MPGWAPMVPTLGTSVLLLCLMALPFVAYGQGLVSEPSLGASGRTAVTHRYALEQAKRLQQLWAKMTPKSCSKGQGTLCGQDVSKQPEDVSIMSSPKVYDARNPDHTGGMKLVNPPGAQGDCNACVAFAVTAAAESAVAARLHVDVSSFSRFSQSYFYFCAGKKSCNKGWNLDDALAVLSGGNAVTSEMCYPWGQTSSEAEAVCTLNCDTGEDAVPSGTFSYTQMPEESLNTVARAQRHIRRWGGVVTSFSLNIDDLHAFVKRSPDAVYNLTGKAAQTTVGHSVVLVGYNNIDNYWIVKQSYGPDFGMGGFIKVALGSAGTMVPDNTYGIKWKSSSADSSSWRPPKATISPAAQNDCVMYKAQRGDYAERVAETFGIPVQQLLSDNLHPTIPEDNPGAWLAGKILTICGSAVAADLISSTTKAASPTSTTPTSGSSQPVSVTSADPQRAALLACAPCWSWWAGASILGSKTSQSTPAQSIDTPTCQLNGITCSSGGTTVITFNMAERVLFGQLPATFSKLTDMTNLDFHSNKLSGSLHQEWASLSKLEYLDLHSNKLSGSLPEAWGKGMSKLTMLDLSSNQLTGTLPTSWTFPLLETLLLHGNQLAGTIPSSWGNMHGLKLVSLHSNQGLRGCLPHAWQGHVHFMDANTNSYTQELTAGVIKGTQLQRWCATRRHLAALMRHAL